MNQRHCSAGWRLLVCFVTTVLAVMCGAQSNCCMILPPSSTVTLRTKVVVNNSTANHSSPRTVACVTGYFPVLTERSTAPLDSGSTPPVEEIVSCQAVQCPTVKTPGNGSIALSCGENLFGGVVRFSCKPGFTLSGSSIIVCLANRSWSHDSPSCTNISQAVVTCPQLSGPGHGSVGGGGVTLNSVRRFKCDGDRRLSGSRTVVCLPSGSWSDAVPTCLDASDTQASASLSFLAWLQEIPSYSALGVVALLLLIIVIFMVACRRRGNRIRKLQAESEPDLYGMTYLSNPGQSNDQWSARSQCGASSGSSNILFSNGTLHSGGNVARGNQRARSGSVGAGMGRVRGGGMALGSQPSLSGQRRMAFRSSTDSQSLDSLAEEYSTMTGGTGFNMYLRSPSMPGTGGGLGGGVGGGGGGDFGELASLDRTRESWMKPNVADTFVLLQPRVRNDVARRTAL